MLITETQGNIITSAILNKEVDLLCIEWYEANKRILHKQTSSGINVVLKFLNKNPGFKDGDILWQDESRVILIEINSCECIVITPSGMLEASAICYEIGNRHLPLFYDDNVLMVPYEKPIHKLLQMAGYTLSVEKRKLQHPFRTTVMPHLQIAGTGTIPVKSLRSTISS